jgi:outer membrane protein OmpA-like peptidoglycan-associated protein
MDMGTLTATIDEMMTPRLVAGVAARSGVSDGTVRTGMRGAVASILDGLARRTDDPRAMDQLADMVGETPETFDAAQLLDDQGPAVRSGDRLLGVATADRAGLSARLAGYLGVGGRTAASLMAAGAALVMGAFGALKRARGSLDGGAIAQALEAERRGIHAAVPAELAEGSDRDMDRIDRRRFARRVGERDRPNPAWWLLALIPLALLALWVANRTREPERVSVPATTTDRDDIDRDVDRPSFTPTTPPAPLGKPTEAPITRPTPTPTTPPPPRATAPVITPTEPEPATTADLSFPAGSMELKLLEHVQSPSGPDQSTWFELDEVQFATGSSTLEPGSSEQIAHVAAIMEQNPDVTIKVGGYTDAAGGAGVNEKLSTARAESVRDALVQHGVAADRIEAEGYGEQHQRQPSSGAEQANRRAAIRVMER